MITAVPKSELNRIREKRSEEISPLYLENLEKGYYDESNEDSKVIFSCAKGRIPAAQAEQLDTGRVIFDSGDYRVVTVPMGNAHGGPTGEQIFRIAYPAKAFETAMPAAFPASLWLNDALDLGGNGRRDRAFDIIFGEIDRLFRKGEFGVCNQLLESLDIDKVSPNLLVAFLTITLSAHEQLPARAKFYARVEKRLADQPNKAKLLSGLKGPTSHEPRFY